MTGLSLVGMTIRAPFAILRRAGFSPWLALAVAPTNVLGMTVFAFIEWPVERELSWPRFTCGGAGDELVSRVEGYAVHLEGRGKWREAAEVYDELIARAASDDSRAYSRNRRARLRGVAEAEGDDQGGRPAGEIQQTV